MGTAESSALAHPGHAHGPFCIACLLYCHDRPRTILHLTRKARCLHYLRNTCDPLGPAECEELDAEDRVLKRERVRAGLPEIVAVLPAFRAQGPLPIPLG